MSLLRLGHPDPCREPRAEQIEKPSLLLSLELHLSWASHLYFSSSLPLLTPGLLPRLFVSSLAFSQGLGSLQAFLPVCSPTIHSFPSVLSAFPLSFWLSCLLFLPASLCHFPPIPDLTFDVIPFLWETEIDGWRGESAFIAHTCTPFQDDIEIKGYLKRTNLSPGVLISVKNVNSPFSRVILIFSYRLVVFRKQIWIKN